LLFAVTDIETTGGSPSGNAITEVAIIITDGTKIIEEFQTLINPERRIPDYITTLTGIDNQMVEDAPTFDEVAEKLHELFDQKIFVAHNVNFDYSFLKAAFRHYNFTFNQQKLCTVRYSRKVFPGLASYSLGALCHNFGFNNNNPHRAMNDTLMAQKLLINALENDRSHAALNELLKRGKGDAFLPMNLDKSVYHNLPELPGVYYFLDKSGKVIYIGKAKNIKKRIRQHFSGKLTSRKSQGLLKETQHIEYELTGTELIAAIKEDEEIKRKWPKYNSAQKKKRTRYGVFLYEDRKGYQKLAIQNSPNCSQALTTFNSGFTARQWLYDFADNYEVNHYSLSLSNDLPTIKPKELNAHLLSAIEDFNTNKTSFLIKDLGRVLGEISLIAVHKNQYVGFGFAPSDTSIYSFEEALDLINPTVHSDFKLAVIKSFIENNKVGQIIALDQLSASN